MKLLCAFNVIVKEFQDLEDVVMFAFDSVMENLPPVILTDEDICLEIVEKGTVNCCWSYVIIQN